MLRLVKKELREKQAWACLLMAVAVVGVAFDDLSGMYLGPESFTPGFSYALLSLVAVLAGLSGMSSELAAGRADFLFSRPISWKRLLAAKAICALVVVFGVSLVGAAACALFLPHDYTQAVGLGRLATGTMSIFAGTALVWICAAGFSCVLPGVFGSGVVALVVVFTSFFLDWIWMTIGSSSNADSISSTFVFAAPLATAVLLRFGVTLPAKERAKRFALFMGPVMVAAAVVSAIMAPAKPAPARALDDSKPMATWSSHPSISFGYSEGPDEYLVSPDGSHVLIQHRLAPPGDVNSPMYRLGSMERGPQKTKVAVRLVRLRDGVSAELSPAALEFLGSSDWLGPDTLLHPTDSGLESVRLIGPDKLERKRLPVSLPSGQTIYGITRLPSGTRFVASYLTVPYEKTKKLVRWIIEPSTGRLSPIESAASWVSAKDLEWARKGRGGAWTPTRTYYPPRKRLKGGQ